MATKTKATLIEENEEMNQKVIDLEIEIEKLKRSNQSIEVLQNTITRLSEKLKEEQMQLSQEQNAPKWYETNNWNGSHPEIWALQEVLHVDLPEGSQVEVLMNRASFCRIGYGHWILLVSSNRTIHTTDLGDLIKRQYHVIGWEQGTESKPYHIYTPKYYDPERHQTSQEVADVIMKVEYPNAEMRFWKDSKDRP